MGCSCRRARLLTPRHAAPTTAPPELPGPPSPLAPPPLLSARVEKQPPLRTPPHPPSRPPIAPPAHRPTQAARENDDDDDALFFALGSLLNQRWCEDPILKKQHADHMEKQRETGRMTKAGRAVNNGLGRVKRKSSIDEDASEARPADVPSSRWHDGLGGQRERG